MRYLSAILVVTLMAVLPSAAFSDNQPKTTPEYSRMCGARVSAGCSSAFYTGLGTVVMQSDPDCLPADKYYDANKASNGLLGERRKTKAFEKLQRDEVRATAQWLRKHPEFDTQ